MVLGATPKMIFWGSPSIQYMRDQCPKLLIFILMGMMLSVNMNKIILLKENKTILSTN